MNVDESLKAVGSFGRIQGFNWLIYSFVIGISSWQLIGVAFTVGQPDGYRCKLPENGTGDDNISYSAAECHVSHLYNGTVGDNVTTTCVDGWEYYTLHGETSVVTDFDLVCDKAILGSTLVSVHFGGCLFGSYIIGQISDIFGRRLAVFVSLLGIIMTGTGLSFTQSYELVLAMKFLNGCFIPGMIIVSYVHTIEMFPPNHRVRSHLGINTFWSIGMVLLAPLSYALPNWRYLQLAISVCCVPLVPLVWYSYDSIRWLVQRGKLDQAETILRRIANSKNMSHPGFFILPKRDIEMADISTEPAEKNTDDGETTPSTDEGLHHRMQEVDSRKTPVSKKYTLIDLFKERVYIIPTLIVFYNWFSCTLVYYGLLLNATNLVGNKYVNFTLIAMTEVPGYFTNFFVTIRFGRRRPVTLFLAVGGVFCIVTGLIPAETADGTSLTILKLVIAVAGKFFATCAFDLVQLLTTEVFPTVLRNAATGAAFLIGRLGGMVAPFIVFLNVVHSSIPFIVFGVLSLVAGLLTLTLPETNNRSLPETMEDGTKLAKKR